jgi:Na+-transporting NADH:ubiquinone oxidoreductase subunit C
MKFFKEVLFIFVLAFFFAGLTAGANLLLSPRIRLNEETKQTEYLLTALGIPFPKGADASQLRSIQENHVAAAALKGEQVYRGYDDQGNPAAYAFPIGGKGFWGRIEGLLALNNDLNEIKGIVFTKNVETPGLGARITEKWFQNQFKGIKLLPKRDKENYIIVSKQHPEQKNRVDAITGATMTSSLVEKFVNEDIERILAEKDEIRRIGWQSPRRK